jgi:U3 small nucleolar RNA-associated protein 21
MSLPLASLKFSSITSMSFSNSRSKDWDDILTSHQDETFARTWHLQNKRLGKHTLGFKDDFKNSKEKQRALGSVKVLRSDLLSKARH